MENQLHRIRMDIWTRIHDKFCQYSVLVSQNEEEQLRVDRVKIEEIVHELFKNGDQGIVGSLIQNMFRLDRKNTGYVTFHQFANFIIKKYCGETHLQKMHKNGQIVNSPQKKINLSEFTALYRELVLFGQGVDSGRELEIEEKYNAKIIFGALDTDEDGLISYVQYFQMIDRYACMNQEEYSKTFSNNKSQLQYSIVSQQNPPKPNLQVIISAPTPKPSDIYSQYLDQYRVSPQNNFIQTYPKYDKKQQPKKSRDIEHKDKNKDIKKTREVLESIEIYDFPKINGVEFVNSIHDNNLDAIRRAMRSEEKKGILESRESERSEQRGSELNYSLESGSVEKSVQNQLHANYGGKVKIKGARDQTSQISLIETLTGINKDPASSSRNLSQNDSLKSLKSRKKFQDPLSTYLKFDIFDKIASSSIPKSEWTIILAIWNQLQSQFERCSSMTLLGSLRSSQKSLGSESEDVGIDRRASENLLRIILPVQLVNNSEKQQILHSLFSYRAGNTDRIGFVQFSRYVLMYLGEKSLKKYQKSQILGNKTIKNQQEFSQILYQAYGRVINNFYEHKTEIYQIFKRLSRLENEEMGIEGRISQRSSSLSYKEYLRWVSHVVVQLDT